MAQFIVSAAGAAVGFAVGGTTGAQIGWTIGGAVGSTFGPTQKSAGPRLGDLRVTGTEYGQVIPWVAGSPRIAGQIVWASPRRETATTESAGGKGGGGGSEYTTFNYDVDLLILLTENPIVGVSRVWSNSDLVYDGLPRQGVWADLRIYLGSDDQMPDPTYEAAVGVGNAPAYRGRGYVFIQGLQLGQSGAIPNLTFEVGTSEGQELVIGDATSLTVTSTVRFFGSAVKSLTVDTTVDYVRSGFGSGYENKNLQQMRLNTETGTETQILQWTFTAPISSSFQRSIPRFRSDALGYMARGDTLGPRLFGTGDAVGVLYEDDTGGGRLQNADTGVAIGLNVYFASDETATNRRIWGYNRGGGGHTLSSPLITSNVYTMFADEDFVYVAFVAPRVVRIYTRSLVFVKDVNRPAFADVVNDIYPNVFKIGSDVCLVALRPATGARAFWKLLPDDTWLDLWQIDGPDTVDFTAVQNGYFGWASGAIGSSTYIYRNVEIISSSETTQTTDPIPLDIVVDKLMERAGYESSDYDVTELEAQSKLVRAMVLGNIANTRSALEVLQSAYFFEAAKSDKIYFRPRAATPAATIFYDDLNTKSESGPDGEPFALTVANDLEIPSQIGLTYANMLSDYQNSTEYSERVFVTQYTINSVQIPLGLRPAEAKGVADAMLIDQIASKASAPLSLPLDYAALEPSDVVEVQTPDRVYRMRLISRTDAAGILSYEAVVDDANALTSAEITDPDYPTQSALLQVAETIGLALDVPIFNDGANAPGYYVVAKQDTGDLWPGAVFLRSFDDVSFSQVQQFPGQNTFGDCDTTLGAWSGGYVWDETNTLDVTVNGELSSSTKDAMLQDVTINVALVGEDGSWECLRFRNAELLDVGQYRLSGFLRGFRGTEWAMDSHGAGETFVHVTEAIRRVATDVSQINLLRYLKYVTAGFRADSVTSVEFTDTGIALKPFAPVNAVALADGSDVVVTWQRRTRLTTRYGGAAPGQVVPLGEAAESYEVQIFNGSTLVRTEVVSSPTYTYLAADWATDGFSSTDVATFIIAQQSLIVGNGYETEVEGIIP